MKLNAEDKATLKRLISLIIQRGITDLFIDLFAGAGGVSEGIQLTDKALTFYAVNHDLTAIRSHEQNHDYAFHSDEDIKTFDMTHLKYIMQIIRKIFPRIKFHLWASLECTNFSKAKGGKPRDADSRTLAEHLYRYIEVLGEYIDKIWIENVVEFMAWGPLDENGKPISKKNGIDFVKWYQHIETYGYRCEYKELNAADFGAHTSRIRLFMQFAKPHVLILWPLQTHVKKSKLKKVEKVDLFSRAPMQQWKPVREVLDFDDVGISIFDEFHLRTHKQAIEYITKKRKKAKKGKKKVIRKICVFPSSVRFPQYGMEPKCVISDDDAARFDEMLQTFLAEQKLTIAEVSFYRYDPFSEQTLKRIMAGLIKYIGPGNNAFIQKYYSGRPKGKVNDVEEPASTVTTVANMGLVQTEFILKYNSTDKKGVHFPPSVQEPCPTIVAQNRLGLVKTEFIMQSYSGNPMGKVTDVDSPARTITATAGNMNLVQPYLVKYYGNGDNVQSVEEPAGTIRTKDTFILVQTDWLDKQYTGEANHQSMEAPAGSIMPNDKHCKVMAEHFINRPLTGGGFHSSVEDPAGAIMSSPKLNLVTAEKVAPEQKHYLLNPQWFMSGLHGVDKPCFTLIARMDKAPPYLITTDEGYVAIPIYECDSETTKEIKRFMAAYGIIDIKMRMLKVSELKLIQGFKEKYILLGNQTDQKKFIGNSVPPYLVKAMISANCMAA